MPPMLSQGKSCFQAEIDAACGTDFLRFNAYYAQEIHAPQPESADGIWNRLEYRPWKGLSLPSPPSTSQPFPATSPQWQP